MIKEIEKKKRVLLVNTQNLLLEMQENGNDDD